MSEDYTWDETVTEHGYAVQNAGLKRDNATLAQRVMELERENAALRTELSATQKWLAIEKLDSGRYKSVMELTDKQRKIEVQAARDEMQTKVGAIGAYIRYLINWRVSDGVWPTFEEWYETVHTSEKDGDL